MRLKDDYGKELLLLDEENLIYRRKFRKITIKRDEIRSVFYDEDIFGVLTYSGKIYSLKIVHLLFSERKKLEELRLELNKENILFDYGNYRNNMLYLPVLWFYPAINNVIFRSNNTINFILDIIFLLGLISFFIFRKNFIPNVIYNIDLCEFEIIKRKSILKYKKHEIDKIKLIRENTNSIYVELKKNRNRYKLYFKENPYLIKIYNLSLIKLFNENF